VTSRVLVVVPEPSLRENLSRALRARGVGVDACEESTEVYAAVGRGRTWVRAVIALDLAGTDGATLAHDLLQQMPALEITFLTGGTDASVLCRAQAVGTLVWPPFGMGPLCERIAPPVRASGTFARRTTSRRSLRPPAVSVGKK